MSFLEELVKKNIIHSSQIGDIKNRAKEKYNGDIYETLLGAGIDEDELIVTYGEYLKIPIKKIKSQDVSFEVLKYIPESSAIYYGFVPLKLAERILEVGIINPENIKAMDALQFISVKLGIPFKIFLISRSAYKDIINNYKGLPSKVSSQVAKLDINNKNENKNSDEGTNEDNENTENDENKNSDKKIVEDAPTIKIVEVILQNAIEGNASDIHIEPTAEKVKVRYRVDGSLYTTLFLPKNIHSGIIARIKILSKLRLDEKRKPQDGSFSSVISLRKVDFRVSIMPAYYGEKIVIRILDSEKGIKSLNQLGLSETNLGIIKEILNRPYGLVLITGPTGSGKSTTLYSMVNELDKEKINVVSLEDPVEYQISDVTQSQVMPEIGYTFASGLRSIVRQDPDVIMVGEIRDKETAELAIQAALTGHLVFSTLHTNSAVGAIPRLVDMGIDPYLIAPTLILSIAQRLVRKTCASSKKLVPMDESIKIRIQKEFEDLPEEFRKKIEIKNEMYETVPSSECPFGTKGRVSVFEMFKVDAEMQNVILKNPINSEIYKVARKNGMLTMQEDAMIKAVNGIIPFTEVYNLGE
jgi:type IV pilus assembly protein PilB